MMQWSKYHKKHVAIFISFVLTIKIIENASVTLLFCYTSDNTVYSLILNIAVNLTVGSPTSQNAAEVKISQAHAAIFILFVVTEKSI